MTENDLGLGVNPAPKVERPQCLLYESVEIIMMREDTSTSVARKTV